MSDKRRECGLTSRAELTSLAGLNGPTELYGLTELADQAGMTGLASLTGSTYQTGLTDLAGMIGLAGLTGRIRHKYDCPRSSLNLQRIN